MNDAIKSEIRAKGLKQWQVAEAIGVCERTLVVWLRTELSTEHKKQIADAIERLSKGGLKNAREIHTYNPGNR